jgi:hypothetical protein
MYISFMRGYICEPAKKMRLLHFANTGMNLCKLSFLSAKKAHHLS